MKLYGMVQHNFNACHWYRTMMPWRAAKKLGLADPILDITDLNFRQCDLIRRHAALYADIIQHYQNYSPGFEHSCRESANLGSYWEAPDKWNVGPHFVFDTDDDLFRVEPMNPAFKDLGWMVDGSVVPKGHSVSIETPDGETHDLYVDGQKNELGQIPFDVEENVKRLVQIRNNMKAAHLITTTTEGGWQYVYRETGRVDTHIFPNCIDFEDWPRIDLAQDDKVRILWQASATHFEDMWPLADALARVHHKYKNTEIILFGAPYKWLTDKLDHDRLQALPFIRYELYQMRMNTLNHDINLAPLHPSEFNNVRSAIRMYESAAPWKPAATLAQNTGSFAKEIQDGVTGMLFSTPEEFETKLSQLVEDSGLRRNIAANAKDWVRTNRDPAVHVPLLLDKYQGLRDARKAVSTPPPPMILKPETNGSVPADLNDVRPGEDGDRGVDQPAEHIGVSNPSG